MCGGGEGEGKKDLIALARNLERAARVGFNGFSRVRRGLARQVLWRIYMYICVYFCRGNSLHVYMYIYGCMY